MKETPIFEEVFMHMLRLPSLWITILIGGLLSFVPVLNLFAFGYLYRLSKGLREGNRLALPEWTDWRGLFMDGLKFAVVWLAYWLLPLLLAFAISALVLGVGLGALAYIVLSISFLFATVLFSSALYRYHMKQDFQCLLHVPLILRMTYMEIPRFIVPSLALLGVFVVAAPLYGFAVFFGFMVLIIYTSLIFRAIEQRRSVAL